MKTHGLRVVIFILINFYSSYIFSQAKPGTLNNQSVIALVKAGLDKSIILTTINNSESKFDVSTTAIINLKKQGVPIEIINRMLEKAGGKVPGNPGDVGINTALSNADPGIYYLHAGKLIQLEPSVFTQSKTGNGIAAGLTYGLAKVKSKAILSGNTSNLQLSENNPLFYFIFPRNGGGNIGNEGSQMVWYNNATSPNEFILIKFKSINTNKQKGREVVTGTFGTYSGFSGGIPDADKASFRFEKLLTGTYKIYFETPLPAGEYAFIYAGNTANAGGAPAQRAFDFSVK